jgi:hypothetical protein
LQAVSSWSLAVGAFAGVVAVAACLLSAVTSAKLTEQIRVRAEHEAALERRHAADARAEREAAAVQVREARARTDALAAANSQLQTALAHQAPPPGASGPEVFARRAHAFAALIRGKAPELALIVGHGPGAHASGQVMRAALKAEGVAVRWCRLKPSAEADRADAADSLTVYGDPSGAEALALVEALTKVGFRTELAAARRPDPGLPSPAIVFAAPTAPARSSALATCNPVLGPGDGR